MTRKPNNGPSFSKATYKQKPFDLPSPDAQKAKEDEIARDAARSRRFRTLYRKDRAAWLAQFLGKKDP
jgi:hypothetical protein